MRSTHSHEGTKHSAPSTSAIDTGDRRCCASRTRDDDHRVCSATSHATTRNTVDRRQPIASANSTPGQHAVVATGRDRTRHEQAERPGEVAERGGGDPEPRVGGEHERRPARRCGCPPVRSSVLQRPTARGRRTARSTRFTSTDPPTSSRKRGADLVDRGAGDPRHRVVAVVEPAAARLEHAAPRRCRCRSRAARTAGRPRRTARPRPTGARAGRPATTRRRVTSRHVVGLPTTRATAPSGAAVAGPVERAGSRRRASSAPPPPPRGATAPTSSQLAASGQRHRPRPARADRSPAPGARRRRPGRPPRARHAPTSPTPPPRRRRPVGR